MNIRARLLEITCLAGVRVDELNSSRLSASHCGTVRVQAADL
jgi:hypothetical protein